MLKVPLNTNRPLCSVPLNDMLKDDCTVTYFSPPLSVWPHLFCGAGLEKKRGEQLKWPLTFRLYRSAHGSFPCAQPPGPVHTARLGRVCFSILILGLCFACSFVLFYLFVCPHSFVFPWAVESSPLQFLALE